jgi:hypothetical protein
LDKRELEDNAVMGSRGRHDGIWMAGEVGANLVMSPATVKVLSGGDVDGL